MAGLIPQSFIDDLLTRIDIVELIDSYVPLKKRGHNFLACCPFHQEKTPSFTVTATKQFYHCFGCSASGNAISFIMAYRSLEFVETIEELAARCGLEVPRSAQQTHKLQQTKDYYSLLSQVQIYYTAQFKQHSQGSKAIKYLQQRGVSGEIAKRYLLGYAPPGWDSLIQQFASDKNKLIATGMLIEKDAVRSFDRYRNRVMFPIHDRRGRIIGFGGRVIDSNDQPKYLNSPETAIFHKSRELYGLHQVLTQNNDPEYIIIVEGYMDVIALAQNDIPHAVATLGTATSSEHIQLLSRYTKQIVFCFDGDQAGRKAAWKAVENSLAQLTDGLSIKFIFLPTGEDPDSVIRAHGNENFIQQIYHAHDLHTFFFEQLSGDLDLTQISARSRLIELTIPYLQQLPHNAYRQFMLDKLSSLTHLTTNRLEQLLTKQTTMQQRPATTHKTPSNLRLAIALLLQNPQLITTITPSTDFAVISGAGEQLLHDLISLLQRNNNLTTGQLIENFRQHEYFNVLQQLGAWELHVPTTGFAAELNGALEKIARQATQRKINQLLTKVNNKTISDNERQELQQLIYHTKHSS